MQNLYKLPTVVVDSFYNDFDRYLNACYSVG